MNTSVMDGAMAETQANLSFLQWCGGLVRPVWSLMWSIWLPANETLYMADGRTHAERLMLPQELVQACCCKRAVAAGVIAYRAFLSGENLIYFGRNGEMHIEEFPRASRPVSDGGSQKRTQAGNVRS